MKEGRRRGSCQEKLKERGEKKACRPAGGTEGETGEKKDSWVTRLEERRGRLGRAGS